FAFLNHLAKYSMDDQVRIAANGRSEMRVGLHCQSEVAAILRSVPGALHRTQHQVGKHSLFRKPARLSRQLLKSALRRGAVHRKFMAERPGDFSELFDLREV